MLCSPFWCTRFGALVDSHTRNSICRSLWQLQPIRNHHTLQCTRHGGRLAALLHPTQEGGGHKAPLLAAVHSPQSSLLHRSKPAGQHAQRAGPAEAPRCLGPAQAPPEPVQTGAGPRGLLPTAALQLSALQGGAKAYAAAAGCCRVLVPLLLRLLPLTAAAAGIECPAGLLLLTPPRGRRPLLPCGQHGPASTTRQQHIKGLDRGQSPCTFAGDSPCCMCCLLLLV